MQSAAFKITANQQDITALVRDRLLSLSVRDAAGEDSDTVSITLDNRDNAIRLPSTGAELDIWIGYDDALVFKGTFQVDELVESLTDDSLSISGKAAKFKAAFKAPRDASFDDVTLGALVEQIAAAHGFTPAVSAELASVHYPHIDQVAESDMNLLTRLAREQGAIAKPVAGKLVVVPRGQSKTVSGKALPEIAIDDPWHSSGQVTIQERTDYQAVAAHWFDEAAQAQVTEMAGSGEPKYTIRQKYADRAAAQAAAKAKLAALQRGKSTLALTRPLMPEVVAECRLVLSRHKTSANGAWVVEECEHVIGSGGVAYTSMTCVIPTT